MKATRIRLLGFDAFHRSASFQLAVSPASSRPSPAVDDTPPPLYCEHRRFMAEVAINLRCSDCAFLNPAGAKHCGMCGSRLAVPRADDRKPDDADAYEKHILTGDLNKASDYGSSVWGKEMWKYTGITLLALAAFLILSSITLGMAVLSRKIAFLAIDYFFAAFLLAVLCRLYLDSVRGRAVQLSRGIVAGWSRLLPAALMLLWVLIACAILAGLFWLWLLPGEIFGSMESGLLSGAGKGFVGVWVTVMLFQIIVPAVVLLTEGLFIGLCRVVDGRPGAWSAIVWTFHRMSEQPWLLIRVGIAQAWVQLIAASFCGLGLLFSLAWGGVTMAAVYEWLRLHGPHAEEY
jgi:hypothetical protein